MVRFGARAAGLTAEFEERLQALPRQRSLSKTATWREQLSKTSPTTICLTVVALLTAAYLLLIRPIQLRSLECASTCRAPARCALTCHLHTPQALRSRSTWRVIEMQSCCCKHVPEHNAGMRHPA